MAESLSHWPGSVVDVSHVFDNLTKVLANLVFLLHESFSIADISLFRFT